MGHGGMGASGVTDEGQGVRTAVRCPDCGGTAVRSVGQSLLHGRELRWDAERFCPQCAAVCCDWGQEATRGSHSGRPGNSSTSCGTSA